jgi:uncharacterized membrane protein YgaE (UPF0421/DUF939 family)
MTNEVLQLQVWLLGGVISFLLVVLIGILKSNLSDIKKVLDDHTRDISELKNYKASTDERYTNNKEIVNEIRTKLDLIYELHRAK